MRHILAAVLMIAAGATAAQECGRSEACEIGDGGYYARAPEGPARGAVMFLHGYRGTGAGTIGNASLVDTLLGRGYAVLAPSGMPVRQGSSGGRWNAAASPDWRNDVDFLQRVADDAAERFGFPRNRILAAGFSGGGMMAWRLACDAPDSFAAYAPISGLMWRPLPEECVGPVRLFHTHGWSDGVVPLEGRSVGGGRIIQGDLFEGLDLMRRASGCDRDDPDAYDRVRDTLIRAWTDCAPGGELVFALHPGGHGIPPGWVVRAVTWFEAAAPAGSG